MSWALMYRVPGAQDAGTDTVGTAQPREVLVSTVRETSTVTIPDPDETARLRRAGRFLVGSFVAFLLGFVAVIVSGITSGVFAAEEEAAERLGVGINELPVTELVRIYQVQNLAEIVLVTLPLVLAPVLLVLGVRRAAAVAAPRHRSLATVSTVLAAGSAAAFLFVQYLYAGVYFGLDNLPPLVAQVGTLGEPFVVVSAALGGAALLALVPVLRARGVARRTGIAVAVLSALTVLGCLFAPPFAPYVVAVVLGVALARTRSSATM